MYGWELPFKKQVLNARAEEHSHWHTIMNWDSFVFAVSLQTPFLASAFIFVGYTLGGNTLTAEKVFPTMFLLNIFKIQAGLFLSGAIQFWTSYKVSQKNRGGFELGEPRNC